MKEISEKVKPMVFGEKISKEKYTIRMDIMFGEPIDAESAERKVMDALRGCGVIGHRGGIC